MYNQNEAKAMKYAEQAAPLQSHITGIPAPDQIPMSSAAADLFLGLVELNGSLRTLRGQLFGPEPEAAANKPQQPPSSLGQAVYLAGMELREAHSQVASILNRL